MKTEVKDFFDKWDYQKRKLTIPIVDHHVEKIKYKLKDHYQVKVKMLQKHLMSYCYNYKTKFLSPGISLNQMLADHKDYIKNRKRAGVIAITKDNKVLVVQAFGKVWFPKGKENYYDADLKETAVREAKEESSKNFLLKYLTSFLYNKAFLLIDNEYYYRKG